MAKQALLIVDHGSRFFEANEMLDDVVKMLRRLRSGLIVEGAHMELCEPDISQGINTCVELGATEIVVHPYMLSPGRHATTDIPTMVQEVATHYPNVSIRVTACLGVDDRLGEVVLDRAAL